MQRGMIFLLALVPMVAAQGGSDQYSPEDGPAITLERCTAPGQCSKANLKLTIDSNWRWTHVKGDYKNCYEGNLWLDVCPGDDGKACAAGCDLEGNNAENYAGTYGVTPFENGVQMQFVNKHEYGVSVGSRLYMYNGKADAAGKYEMFYVNNQEIAFDSDMSGLECGMNGAIYLVEMQENGGYGLGENKAGAKYGTGYCDAQCPHDMKFIDGEANIKDWKPNEKDKSGNMGMGYYGACCNEMDIWEANAHAQAFTPHPCNVSALYRCEGGMCGDNDAKQRYEGVCDKDGCDFASYRMGDKKFYGKGSEFKINTNKVFTQVQQWVTDDGTDGGVLVEIRKVWKQGGKVVENTNAPHMEGTKVGKCKGAGTTLNDDICWSQNQRFGDYNHFQHHGGHKVMGESLARGHVLAISLWDDVDVSMMWLDSCYPRGAEHPCTRPGVGRGPCKGGDESTPTYVRKTFPDNNVKYTNFKTGCLGCTTAGVGKGPKPYVNEADSDGGPVECPYGGDDDKGGGGNDNDNGEVETRRRRRDTPPRRRRAEESGRRRRRAEEESRRRGTKKESRRRRTKKESRRRRTKEETSHRRRRRTKEESGRRRRSKEESGRRRRSKESRRRSR